MPWKDFEFSEHVRVRFHNLPYHEGIPYASWTNINSALDLVTEYRICVCQTAIAHYIRRTCITVCSYHPTSRRSYRVVTFMAYLKLLWKPYLRTRFSVLPARGGHKFLAEKQWWYANEFSTTMERIRYGVEGKRKRATESAIRFFFFFLFLFFRTIFFFCFNF